VIDEEEEEEVTFTNRSWRFSSSHEEEALSIPQLSL